MVRANSEVLADLLARLGEQNREILQQAADSEKLKIGAGFDCGRFATS